MTVTRHDGLNELRRPRPAASDRTRSSRRPAGRLDRGDRRRSPARPRRRAARRSRRRCLQRRRRRGRRGRRATSDSRARTSCAPPARRRCGERSCVRETRPRAPRPTRPRGPTRDGSERPAVVFCSAAASLNAASSPSSAARPPVTSTTPLIPADTTSRRYRPAIDWWMPAQDVRDGDAARDHVDDVGLGEDRADRRARLGLVGLSARGGRFPRASRRGSARCSRGTGPIPTRTGSSSGSRAPSRDRPCGPPACAARRCRRPRAPPAPGTARRARASSCRRSGRCGTARARLRRWSRCRRGPCAARPASRQELIEESFGHGHGIASPDALAAAGEHRLVAVRVGSRRSRS